METGELVHEVQVLSQAAGLAYNIGEVMTAKAKLKDLLLFLIDEVVEPDETPEDVAPDTEETVLSEQEAVDRILVASAAPAAETEQVEPEGPAVEEPAEPGPESEPSEE